MTMDRTDEIVAVAIAGEESPAGAARRVVRRREPHLHFLPGMLSEEAAPGWENACGLAFDVV